MTGVPREVGGRFSPHCLERTGNNKVTGICELFL